MMAASSESLSEIMVAKLFLLRGKLFSLRWLALLGFDISIASTRKFPCAGNAGLPPLNLYARVRISLCNLAHETAGAARTRHSLHPLFEGDANNTRTHRAA